MASKSHSIKGRQYDFSNSTITISELTSFDLEYRQLKIGYDNILILIAQQKTSKYFVAIIRTTNYFKSLAYIASFISFI